MRTTKQIFAKTVKHNNVYFNRRDKFMRAYGCNVITYECAFSINELGEHDHDAGLFFAALITRTRGGFTFGNQQKTVYFLTELERDQYVLKRVAQLLEDAAK